MLCMGTVYVLKPFEGDAPIGDTVAGIAAHRHLYEVIMWLGLPFLVGFDSSRRCPGPGRPGAEPLLSPPSVRVGTLLGCLSAFQLRAPDDLLAYLAVTEGLEVATVAALDDAWWALPVTGAAALLFISGIVVGLPLLGIALWRSRASAARRTPLASILGGGTYPSCWSTATVAAVHRATGCRSRVRRRNPSLAANDQRRLRSASHATAWGVIDPPSVERKS